MLWEELHDSDIPHHTTICSQVIQVWEDYLNKLQDKMEVNIHFSLTLAYILICNEQKALGKISTTMDMWSDPNLSPFMAQTAHWIQAKTIQTPDGPQHILTLRVDLIDFLCVPGHHDGEHLAHVFIYITNKIGITHNISCLFSCSCTLS
jgi:hypothetical protein